VRILANPVFLRAAVVFFCATFSFLLGLMFIRMLRKSIDDESSISSEASPSIEGMPLHVYNTVIQELKNQKQELQVQSQAELLRARTSEAFSQSVLANLSCGVLVFGSNGLVKSSNPAAKAILGFASTTGMGVDDIYRGSIVSSSDPEDPVCLADEVQAAIRDGGEKRQVEAEYETPAGESRFISVTVSPITAIEGSLLGVACLIHDLSELQQIRRSRAQHGETSAEMALQLRTSLTTISGYARQLVDVRDPEQVKKLANNIAEEAGQLDRSLGGFLTKEPAALGAAVGSTD